MEKFSFNQLITGLVKSIMSPRTWVWCFASMLTYTMCYRNGDHPWLSFLIVCWCIICVFFMGGKAFQDALNYMIKKRMDVNVQIGD